MDEVLFKGIKLSTSLTLSHLFYADDAMFVGQWCDTNIDTLVHVLECFYYASGLKINMCKSKIMGVHVDDTKVKNAASKLGCLILKIPFLYLGTKVGRSMSCVHEWKEVVDKVRSRLLRWKMNMLSISGRLTLLKSVLGSTPIFHMSIFKVRLSVLQVLESIRSHFFKGNDMRSNKAYWVKWSNVLTAKEKGGLGVSSLFALNRGLMLKWVWRFYSQKTSLWVRIIKAIHGNDGKMGKDIYSGIRSCWLNIVREVKELQIQGINVFDYIRLKLGNGESILFWEEKWSNDSVLKDLFPRLYALESNKLVTVGAKLKDSSMDNSFRRKARGGVEMSQYETLIDMVNSASLVPMADRYIWSLENSSEFSVASIRKVIDGIRYPGGNSKTRWVKFVPIKVNVLAWKIKLDALPSRFNISLRGISIESLSCPICDSGVESTSHIFFKCCLVRQVAGKIARWWNVDILVLDSYEDWLTWMLSLRLTVKRKMMLEGIFYTLWWLIWSYRNKLLFESKAPKKALIFDNVVSNAFYWYKYRCKASFSWDDWLKNPYLILV